MTPSDWLIPRFSEAAAELFDFLRIPSISARSEHKADVANAAEWLATKLIDAGLAAEIFPTAGHPIVLGEWRGAGPAAPTYLVYGHYDVQPVEPLDLWTSPPFEPSIRDERIYARGSVDDKGQLYLHVKALQAHLEASGSLPVNVLVLAEGEEEVGSANLPRFIEQHADRLKCDGVIISDSAMFAPGLPSILFSLRGMSYLQVDVEGPRSDLHSGSYGGAVVNPATALAHIVASFHDDKRRVVVKGFYDDVVEWDDEVRTQIRGLPFQDATFREETGAPALGGEAGYSTLERIWTRPTLEVNGLLSGYTGEGAKTVLPSKAMAKISCRLVPDQTPDKIARLVTEHIRRVAPPEIKVVVTALHSGMPWKAKLEGQLFEAGVRALQRAFATDPVLAGEGGSIPIVGDFQRILGVPVLLMGFGLPGENAHAPDEWMAVENFEKGMLAAAYLWEELASDDANG